MGAPAAILIGTALTTGVGLVTASKARKEAKADRDADIQRQKEQAAQQQRLLEEAPEKIEPSQSTVRSSASRLRALRSGFGSTLRTRPGLGSANVSAPSLTGQRTLLGQ